MSVDLLSRLAIRVSDPAYDPRHAILDITAELNSALADTVELPPHLAAELRELCDEIGRVQPTYPSRRETSPLFDRVGLGRPGRERAERLVRRLVSLARSVQRTTGSDLRPPGNGATDS